MQENRSFDSYFGTFPGADGIPMINGEPAVCVPDTQTNSCIKPYHNPFDQNAGGPHGAVNAVNDVDGGKMDGFVSQALKGLNCGGLFDPTCPGNLDVMGYHDANDIANYWTYAQNFVLQDHMFEPNASWSLPAHLFMVSEWSAYCTQHDASSCTNALETPGLPLGFDGATTNPIYAWTDLTYLMHKYGVSWGYYVVEGTEPDCENDEDEVCPPIQQNAMTPGIWNPLPYFDTVKDDGELGNIQAITNFLSQAQAGTLPAVSWIVPSGDVSEHPPGLVTAGQSYVTALINAVMSGPNWSDCAIFLAWDDWGGFYDHVPPVQVDENGYGLRVPGMVISPYAKRGYIDHQTLSFDAYVKFIEDVFLGSQRLNPQTDGRPDPRPDVREGASQLGDLSADFDFTQAPRGSLILPVHPATALIPNNNIPEEIGTYVDVPGPQSGPFLGSASFSGWAIDNAVPITNVNVSVDGVPIGMADYGSLRPDVCAVYPAQVGCSNVGWSFSFDTTTLASGTHSVEVTATSASGQHSTAGSSFAVANWIAATADPMRVDIDSPNSSSTAFSGFAGFGGWAIDDIAAITQVSIAVDGIDFGNAAYGGNRADVCNVFPGRAGCPNVGWNFLLNTALLTDDTHTLAVTASSSGGAHTTMTASFTVANHNPIRIWIDRPNSQSAVFSGTAGFGGWAIDDNAAISMVSLSIDGMSIGDATYGGTRTDVCSVFPGRAGCPNVGWNFDLNTTLLADGAHTLQVTATAADGQKASVTAPFSIANSISGNPTKVSIDQPNAQASTLIGVTAFSGSAINDNSAISSVAISIDGTSYGDATYGVTRQDVCNLYPGRPGCPNVGWTFDFDTTQLADGAHTLTASATASDGQHLSVSTTFTVANWSTANPMRIDIDNPNAQSSPFSGTAAWGGWAIDNTAAITNVAIAIDGVSSGNAAYGAARPDVCKVFPGRLGCPNVGWNFAVDTTLLADGAHTLDVTATSSGGQHSTATASFQVANLTAANPIRINIDRPNAQMQPLSGTVAIGGWAIDTDSVLISGVAVSVDGVLAGTAIYGGSRSDVCAVYPSAAGCPKVGWNFFLDTTVLGNGKHTLEVRAMVGNGQHATQSTTFTVAN